MRGLVSIATLLVLAACTTSPTGDDSSARGTPSGKPEQHYRVTVTAGIEAADSASAERRGGFLGGSGN